jgi:uncharacterized protein with von Willebrand factor type A (vWA) domain
VPDLADVASRFSALLHAAGVPVTPERAGRFASALFLSPPAFTSDLYWLARVTLVTDQGHIPVFDAVFASVFEGIVDPADFRGDTPPLPTIRRGDRQPKTPEATAGSGSMPSPGPARAGEEGEPSGQESLAAMMSSEERLRHQDFAHLTPEELADLRAVAMAAPPRRTRRTVRYRTGAELDVRATLRRARRSGGEPFSPVRRRRRVRPRRVVLICDISGSMERYARAYLQLLWSGVASSKAEAFVFATRLTRLTRALRGVSPDVALEQAGLRAPDWSGGTRIGEALKAFNDGYGRRGVARGAVVLILSDGWDTGDADLVAREMDRLHRLAYRIVWVNPRKAAAGYLPLARGMAAALPHVDAFVSGHNLAALDEVLEAIAS